MKTPKRKPILAEPDQKYWRRKANQRVRKQRLTRNLARWAGIFAANALIAGGIVYGGLEASAKQSTTRNTAPPATSTAQTLCGPRSAAAAAGKR